MSADCATDNQSMKFELSKVSYVLSNTKHTKHNDRWYWIQIGLFWTIWKRHQSCSFMIRVSLLCNYHMCVTYCEKQQRWCIVMPARKKLNEFLRINATSPVYIWRYNYCIIIFMFIDYYYLCRCFFCVLLSRWCSTKHNGTQHDDVNICELCVSCV